MYFICISILTLSSAITDSLLKMKHLEADSNSYRILREWLQRPVQSTQVASFEGCHGEVPHGIESTTR